MHTKNHSDLAIIIWSLISTSSVSKMLMEKKKMLASVVNNANEIIVPLANRGHCSFSKCAFPLTAFG